MLNSTDLDLEKLSDAALECFQAQLFYGARLVSRPGARAAVQVIAAWVSTERMHRDGWLSGVPPCSLRAFAPEDLRMLEQTFRATAEDLAGTGRGYFWSGLADAVAREIAEASP